MAEGTEPIESEAAFCDAVWQGIERACEQRLRELTFCDPHFGFWPLSQERVLSGLTTFVRLPGRKLVLVSQGYEHVRRRHPRFVRWRNDWSHAVSPLCLQAPTADLPGLLLADRAYALYLQDASVWSAHWVTERETLLALNQDAQEWRRQAQPDLSVSVTGL